ncbi:MAG: O-antigen ligase family protein [Bacteroidota bacterium]
MPKTWKEIQRYWYIFSLIVTMGSLPFSKFGISFGQFMLTGGWIVERFDIKKFLSYMAGRSSWQVILRIFPYSVYLLFEGIISGFRQFFRNKPALLFSSILLLHMLGLMFTTDYDYAIKDLRTKFPFLLFPLFLSTSAGFDRKVFFRFMLFFVLTVLVRSLFNTWMIQTQNFIDIRDVSRNVSHIIFSLLLSLGIFTLLYISMKKSMFPTWLRGLLLLVMIWFFIYLVISQSFTGFSITLITILILIPLIILNAGNRWLKVGLLVFTLAAAMGIFLVLRSITHDYYHVNPVDFKKLEKVTSRGNPYINSVHATQTENGNYLWIYIQWDEMRSEWNKRSKIPFDSLNLKNGPVAHTVVRYLTSKGWRKDGDAIGKLSSEEIHAIEKGVANCVFLKEFSIRGRIYEFLWGFDNYMETGNPTGSTLMQRLEFWKASLGIIRQNWLTGVGTGDMNLVFKAQYEKMHSKLSPDQRWRSHNQFLSIFIGFGIFGLMWFLVAIFYPPVMKRRQDDFFMIVFLIIAVLSMLTEDTIESQTGVTFFVLFYSFFLFTRREKDPLFPKTIAHG